jgi:transposase
MARKSDPQRNAEIARLMYTKTMTPGEIADKFNISYSQVYRAAQSGRGIETMAATLGAPGSANVTQEGQTIPRLGKGSALFSEMGLSGLRHFSGRVDDEYDRVFKSLNKRVHLFREMGDDPIVASVLQAIKMVVRRASWYYESGGKARADEEAAEFMNTCNDDMSQSWSDTIDQLLACIQYGFYPSELVYKKRQGDQSGKTYIDENGNVCEVASSKYDDGKIGWRKWVFMAPESLSPGGEWIFDDYGGIKGINQQASPLYIPKTIPIEKCILFRTTTEKGNPEGRSLLRAMYIPYWFKKNMEEVEGISAERMGSGFPVMYLGDGVAKAGTPGDDLSNAKDIVVNVRTDEQMGIVIPYPKLGLGREGEGVLFELVSPPSRGAVDFHQTISRHEQRMAMVGLAQFIHLGMNQVGARSLGDSSTDFFTMSVSGWVDMFGETIQRYGVDRLMKLNNFPGLTANPILKHENVEATNVMDVADYINKLVGAQVLTPSIELEEYLLELADLPKPANLIELYAKRDADKKAAAEAQAAQLEAARKSQQPGGGNPPFPKPESEEVKEPEEVESPDVVEGEEPEEQSSRMRREFYSALRRFDEAMGKPDVFHAVHDQSTHGSGGSGGEQDGGQNGGSSDGGKGSVEGEASGTYTRYSSDPKIKHNYPNTTRVVDVSGNEKGETVLTVKYDYTKNLNNAKTFNGYLKEMGATFNPNSKKWSLIDNDANLKNLNAFIKDMDFSKTPKLEEWIAP